MYKLKSTLRYIRSFVYCTLTGSFLAMPVFAGDYKEATNNGTSNITGGKKAIVAVLNILYLVALIVGIIFIAVGIIRFAMSHAQEDGPGQQKAIMMMATGAVLIIVRVILSALNLPGWLDGYQIERVGFYTLINLLA